MHFPTDSYVKVMTQNAIQFFNKVVEAVSTNSIPDQLTINVHLIPSKFVPTGDVTMSETNKKHVAKEGGNDKQGMTLT